MGRLNTMTDLNTSSAIISSASYGPSGELLQMTGTLPESRTYNSMLQLTELTSNGWHNSYVYPATGNNGKITSQADHAWGGETVTYLYDALNRLQKATTGTWSQTFGYDGFGNLNSVVGVNAPNLSANYNGATNRILNEPSDGNGNLTGVVANTTNSYDVANRIATVGYPVGVQYSCAPGNQRVWRGVWTGTNLTTDEVTFWSVTGQRLATYKLTVGLPFTFTVAQTGTNYYFGRRLIKNADDLYVGLDRLGSVGRFYPYAQENPVASWEGREKFTGYFRDAETTLDYANQRYYLQAQGRFATPDPYMASGGPADPGSWNRYAYVGGDPVNRVDRNGLEIATCDPNTDGPICGFGGLGSGDGGGGGGGGCFIDEFVPNPACMGPLPYHPGEPPAPPQNTCSISVYTRPAGFSLDPGQHTYLVVSVTDPSGDKLIDDVLEGDPKQGHSFWKHPLTAWGNMWGFMEPVADGQFQGATNPKTDTRLGGERGGANVCNDIAGLLLDVASYDNGGGGRYSPLPNGRTTFNSNSFAFALLFDAGISLAFQPVIRDSPGWGFLVPGLFGLPW